MGDNIGTFQMISATTVLKHGVVNRYLLFIEVEKMIEKRMEEDETVWLLSH